MLRDRVSPDNLSEFLRYLVSCGRANRDRLPALADLSLELGVSVATLREQMEVARSMGLIEVRPKTGIRRLPYTFRQGVRQSLAYAIATDPCYFEQYADLRRHIESAYWLQAVRLLTEEDHTRLRHFVSRAWQKLNGSPIQIPHEEHRELHLSIYRRLQNPFVTGLLETYWEMYEAVGLARYTDISYLERVWRYHENMVERICNGDLTQGYQGMLDHMNLLSQRNQVVNKQQFE